MKNTTKNTTIIFDMDGIIFDTENMFLGCWQKVAADYGLKAIDEVYKSVIGVHAEKTKEIFLAFYGPCFDYDKLSGLAIDIFYEKARTAGIPQKLGAKELLHALSENNYHIGLASSTRTDIVRSQLKAAGLLKYFKVVVGGDMAEKSKPAPDIFLKALALMEALLGEKLTAHETYAVEDSFNGVRAASLAGMKVIMVPDIVKPDDEMKKLAFQILPNMLAVKELFFGPSSHPAPVTNKKH
ncbi:MAG: HAD-IA family hydrolase [Lachnospiraceae bacterium]|nr:HAD-IA family hydrolase [Lachnospiraceae bacterium]